VTVPTGSTKPAVSFIIIALMADFLSQGVLSGTEWSFKVFFSVKALVSEACDLLARPPDIGCSGLPCVERGH